MSADLYGEAYYNSHLATGRDDLVYERSDHWLDFFSSVADRIVGSLAPNTVLDAGCAIGLLVEALRVRGVEASGIDISEYAISQAHPSVAEHVRVASLKQPIGGTFDLVTCVEVLEHLPPGEIDTAVAHLTAVTDKLLLSTTPDDFVEPTHLNVQPPEYWAAKLASFGFYRDPDFDAAFLTPWAALYRRREVSAEDLVRSYERERWQLTRERDALRSAAVEQLRTSSDGTPLGADDLRQRLREALDAAHGADAQRASVEGRLREAEYLLAASRAREAELTDIFNNEPARLLAISEAKTFKLYWKLIKPYRRLRGGAE